MLLCCILIYVLKLGTYGCLVACAGCVSCVGCAAWRQRGEKVLSWISVYVRPAHSAVSFEIIRFRVFGRIKSRKTICFGKGLFVTTVELLRYSLNGLIHCALFAIW